MPSLVVEGRNELKQEGGQPVSGDGRCWRGSPPRAGSHCLTPLCPQCLAQSPACPTAPCKWMLKHTKFDKSEVMENEESNRSYL